jgi:putative spermidine/putrescine transport system substrate-binding protein
MRIRVVNERPPSDEGDGSFSEITRRDALIKGAAGVGVIAGVPALAGCGGSSSSSSAASGGGSSKGSASTLRVLGIGVDQNPVLAAQAKKDLGITLQYTITDTPTTTQKSITQPQNFDILHGYVHQVPQILPAGVMQPIDTSKIPLWQGGQTPWPAPSSEPSNLSLSARGFQMPHTKSVPNEVAPVLITGKLSSNAQASYGVGDAAYRMLPLNPNSPSQLTAASSPFQAATAQTVNPSSKIIGMPGVFNVDSIGYDRTKIPVVTSWAELFNPAHKGRVALINDPQIGPIDAALAAQASGKLTFQNIGSMTKGEIDNLTKMLIDMKKAGFFRAFWSTFTESVNLMAGGEVVIESMWSPAQTILLESGKKVGFAAPKEGFRGWCGCTMIYKHVSGPALDAAYKYLNWWLSGFPGANMARQAYYSPRPDTTKKFLSGAEWDYWYGGLPAAENLVGPDGKPAIPKGSIREGGSFTQRIRRYSAWNTTQPQNDYMGTQWNNFISA